MSAHQFHPYRSIPYRTGKEKKRTEWGAEKKTSNFLHHEKYALVGVFSSRFSFCFLPPLTGIEQKLHTEKVIKEPTTTTTNININATIKWNGQRKICDSMFFALFLSFSPEKKSAKCEWAYSSVWHRRNKNTTKRRRRRRKREIKTAWNERNDNWK